MGMARQRQGDAIRGPAERFRVHAPAGSPARRPRASPARRRGRPLPPGGCGDQAGDPPTGRRSGRRARRARRRTRPSTAAVRRSPSTGTPARSSAVRMKGWSPPPAIAGRHATSHGCRGSRTGERACETRQRSCERGRIDVAGGQPAAGDVIPKKHDQIRPERVRRPNEAIDPLHVHPRLAGMDVRQRHDAEPEPWRPAGGVSDGRTIARRSIGSIPNAYSPRRSGQSRCRRSFQECAAGEHVGLRSLRLRTPDHPPDSVKALAITSPRGWLHPLAAARDRGDARAAHLDEPIAVMRLMKRSTSSDAPVISKTKLSSVASTGFAPRLWRGAAPPSGARPCRAP